MTSAAILIGGRARRFNGQFKPLLSIGGRTILARQIDALNAAGIENIALIGGWSVAMRPPLPVFADALEEAGSLGALYTALLVASVDNTIVLAGDMPFVSSGLVRALADLAPRHDAVVPRADDRLHPFCAAYRRSIALGLKVHADRGALRVVEALAEVQTRELARAELEALDTTGLMLMNVNTPADYERACREATPRA